MKSSLLSSLTRHSGLALTRLSGVAATGLLFGSANPALAQLTWIDAGTGIWDNADPNWFNGIGAQAWTPNASAVFTAGGGVTIGDNLDIGDIQFNTLGTYSFLNAGGYALNINGGGIGNLIPTVAPQLFTSNGQINFTGVGTTAGNALIDIASSGQVNFSGTATAGGSTLTSDGFITFTGGAGAGASLINNAGTLAFEGTAPLSTATVNNGAFLDINNSVAGVVPLGSVNNSYNGAAGAVTLGNKELILSNGLSLATTPGNDLAFTLSTPATSGTITILGGAFNGSGTGQTTISFLSGGPVLAGTYDLIDFTGATSVNSVDLADFVLGSLPQNVAVATLKFDATNNILQLVAVPEPSTLIMPMAAVLGLVWLRRRAARTV